MQAVASPVSPADTTRRCYARIGLLGNPSDGYGGATLACSLANFWAEVTCTRAPQITFQFHPVHDCGAYASLEALSAHVSSCGVGTGVDLLKVRRAQARRSNINIKSYLCWPGKAILRLS